MTRKEIELMLGADLPDDGALFIIEFVNQLVADHGEQWVREIPELVRTRLENMGLIAEGD